MNISTAYRLPKEEETRLRVNRFNRAKRKTFKKYGRVCDKCDATTALHIHHTFDKSHHPRKRYVIKWLRVLCYRCHYDFHVSFMGGYGVKCVYADYVRWKEG